MKTKKTITTNLTIPPRHPGPLPEDEKINLIRFFEILI